MNEFPFSVTIYDITSGFSSLRDAFNCFVFLLKICGIPYDSGTLFDDVKDSLRGSGRFTISASDDERVYFTIHKTEVNP